MHLVISLTSRKCLILHKFLFHTTKWTGLYQTSLLHDSCARHWSTGSSHRVPWYEAVFEDVSSSYWSSIQNKFQATRKITSLSSRRRNYIARSFGKRRGISITIILQPLRKKVYNQIRFSEVAFVVADSKRSALASFRNAWTVLLATKSVSILQQRNASQDLWKRIRLPLNLAARSPQMYNNGVAAIYIDCSINP